MKFFKTTTSLLLLFIFSSCGSTMKYTWTKEGYTGKHFDKILVIGVSKNMESRTVFENTVVDLLSKEGITAENSIKAIPPIQNVNQISEERVVKVVQEGNYDGVLVARLIDINVKDVRESGSGIYGPMYGGRGYYGYGYGRYIYSGYNYMYAPDYYRQQQTYVVETRLFDPNEASRDKALVWSGQSKITDPSSFESGASSYAKTLVKSLIKSKILE